jgi:Protein of unknown function (DUF3039)
MSTQVEERPDLQESKTGPDMFHYVDRAKSLESAVFGNFVEALCGEKFPVTKVAKPDSPVCPECKEIYDSLSQD